MAYNRRDFISFLGKASIKVAIIPPFIQSCGNISTPNKKSLNMSSDVLKRLGEVDIEGLLPSNEDQLLLAPNLDYHVLVRWGDQINLNDTFGFNNDFRDIIKKNIEISPY